MKFILQLSHEKHCPIKLFYMDRQGNISERIVRVEKITEHHIKVYCHWRKCFRIFLKKNILSAGLIKRNDRGA